MTPVSHGKPCAGNPHARFEEGASAPETPRRNALLHNVCLFFEGTGQGVAGKITNVTRLRDLCAADARQKLHLSWPRNSFRLVSRWEDSWGGLANDISLCAAGFGRGSAGMPRCQKAWSWRVVQPKCLL